VSKPLDAVGTTGSKISLSDESPAVRNAMKRFNDTLTIIKLEKRIAELGPDKKRLDWLLKALEVEEYRNYFIGAAPTRETIDAALAKREVGA
jgi:hypothetical protein